MRINTISTTTKDFDFTGLTHVKSAWYTGYVSRKITHFDDYPAIEYHGRYGDGIQVFVPSNMSTQYCITWYYVREE